MSRTTKAINQIKEDLDDISGLDGIVADMMEILQQSVARQVKLIQENFGEASIFNYDGEEYECDFCGDYDPSQDKDLHYWFVDNDTYFCPYCGRNLINKHEYKELKKLVLIK